MENVLYM